MARNRIAYVCRSCGAQSPRPDGRCLRCGEFGTLEPETAAPARRGPSLAAPVPVALSAIDVGGEGELRVRTGIGELDRVLGGGLVGGSLVLLGGDPGVGKSTLLLLALDRFARKGLPVLYVTGEESARQVRLRADRLGVTGSTFLLLADTDFANVEEAVRRTEPAVLVVDSIQTVTMPETDGIPGSVGQIREVAHRAMQIAKRSSTSVILVGHITKSGDLAGPKLLEHLVDTVLYFEGDGRSGLRVLRAVKNRFGASGELGLFEMVDDGLVEVPDASARLLQERAPDAAGTAVVASVEGSRPLLVEIQALVGRPTQAIPGRTCVGVDRTRVQMLAAVVEKAGVKLWDRDVFVNAAGGVKLLEPAADLGIALALASSYIDRALPSDVLVFGEIGLVGEVRAVSHPGMRLKEAARHGFRRVVGPASIAKDAPAGLDVIGVKTVREALERLLP
jgi:DNA repair protein RadA/Sms